ncbi:MAG: hypothetical protein IJR54_08820, partial [Oscillibacter sp.]|nr:hypothetical protein [Oscillibacter sp.]
MKKWKRGLALLLTLVMLFSMLPVSAVAAEDVPDTALLLEPPELPEKPDPDLPDEIAPGISEAVTPEFSEEVAPGIPQETPPEEAILTAAGDEKKAYEVSYNLSGSGYWIVIGDDASRKEELSYGAFDEYDAYDIQLRKEDNFPYTVEIRYRMEKDGPWSVPERRTFYEPNDSVKIQGRTLRAQSKWLTQIRYRVENGTWIPLSDAAYDENGNYAIDFPTDAKFPLKVYFAYRTKQNVDAEYPTGNDAQWKSVAFPLPDGGTTPSPEFQDMTGAVTVLGHRFSLYSKALNKVQYSVGTLYDWVTIGPGEPIEREFDTHGNYTIDMGSRTDFPVRVYLRALSVDGWSYLRDADSAAASYKDYSNVLDTENIAGHVFAIHTNWMNDIRYAFVPQEAFTRAYDDYTMPAEEQFYIVGTDQARKDNENYDLFNEDGSYTIEVSEYESYPLYVVFQAISPNGNYEAAKNWTQKERMERLQRFENIYTPASVDFNGHSFSLNSNVLGTIIYKVENAKGSVTHSSQRLTPNERWADSEGRYNIVLKEDDLFPLKITFQVMTEKGWSDETVWTVPFKDWNKVHQEITVPSPRWDESRQKMDTTATKEYSFYLSADFLDDIRYRWADDYWTSDTKISETARQEWVYVTPASESPRAPRSVSYVVQSDNSPFRVERHDFPSRAYAEDGSLTIPLKDNALFQSDANGVYTLTPELTVQWWDPAEGWQNVKNWKGFASLEETRNVETALPQTHTLRLSSEYANEIRYTLKNPDTDTDPEWIIVGNDKERAGKDENYVLFQEDGGYTLSFDKKTVFPVPVYFEAYTGHGWTKPQVTPQRANGSASGGTGTGTFHEAGAALVVQNGNTRHVFSADYPWANSVSYTLTDREPPVTFTIGPNKEYAESDPAYYYVPPAGHHVIELEEGDFFPAHITFTAKDNQGRTKTEQAASGEVTFTQNAPSEIYRTSGYSFSVNSNWMNTIRVYLPERTVSVGNGMEPDGKTKLSDTWLKEHPNYKQFDKDGNYTIDLRQNDTFPLTVEFLKRSVDGDQNPVKLVFESMADRQVFDGHTFFLRSNYTDTVRYIVAYDEDLLEKQTGRLKPEYADRVQTVVWNADWAKNHDHYAFFDQDGNYQIPLPEDSAFPVDVWFAVPDQNGSYDNAVYRKVTFKSKDDKETVVWPLLPPADTEAQESAEPNAQEPVKVEHTFSVYAEWMDEVRYTLPQIPKKASLPTPRTVTVGPDKERAAQESVNAKEESREPLYVTYAEDGSYVIKLEDDAFFPYVVDVTYRLPNRAVYEKDENGEIVTDEEGNPVLAKKDGSEEEENPYEGEPAFRQGKFEFKTPGSTVRWNGHEFRVQSARTNPNAAVRASLWLGNREVPLRLAGMPETPAKPVKDAESANPDTPAPNPNPAISPSNPAANSDSPSAGSSEQAELLSTQALTEVQLYADLTGYFNLELDNARVEVYMPNLETQREELAKEFAWGEWQIENYDSNRKRWNVNPWDRNQESVRYTVLGTNKSGDPASVLKLSKYAEQAEATDGTQYFEIITGSTEHIEQLNLSNIRYLIKTTMGCPDYNELLKMKVAYVDNRRGGAYVIKDGYEHLDESHWNEVGYIPPGMTTIGRDAYTVKTDGGEKSVDVYRFTVGETWQDGPMWLTMKLNEKAKSYKAFKDLTADVYEGFYFTAADAAASGKKINKPVWGTELDTQRLNERYESYTAFVNGTNGIENGPRFTVIWKWKDQPVAIMPFRVIVDVQTREKLDDDGKPIVIAPVTFDAPHTHNDFIPDENGNYKPNTYLELIGGSESISSETGVLTAAYFTKTEGNLFDNRYYVQANYNLGKWQADEIKVYAGPTRYATLAEAVAATETGESSRAMDVTEQIFGEVGYGADYSIGHGVVFSAFNRAGTLIASKQIITYRREFLSFGKLTRPSAASRAALGELTNYDGSTDGLDSDIARNKIAYSRQVVYNLPDSEYRGVYKSRSRYDLEIGYMRDLVPSSLSEYGAKIVVATRAYENATYEEIMAADERPIDLTGRAETKTAADGQKYEVIHYAAPYRNGFYFHLYDKDGKLLDAPRYVIAKEPRMSENTYFEVYGAQSANGGNPKTYQAYVMPGNMDSYYDSGYQTVLLLDNGKPVTDKKIVPLFDVNDDGYGHQVRIYAASIDENGKTLAGARQTSGDTRSAVEFNGGNGALWDGSEPPVLYTSISTDEVNLQNYWVTFLTQQKGPKLFVNAANNRSGGARSGANDIERHVFLQESTGNYQDIFIANIGDEPLENITVSFQKGANANVKVDDYWTIQGGSAATTLSAFTSTTIKEAPGEGRYSEDYDQTDLQPSNVAKIRVYPKDPNRPEAIDDVMIIAAHDKNGRETDRVEVKLSGRIGNYEITTTALTGDDAQTPSDLHDDYHKNAVQYVSFSRLIQTNWNIPGGGVHFEVTEGRLPDGFPAPTLPNEPEPEQISPAGEIFGVPLETGDFTFTVTATFSYPANSERPVYVSTHSRTYTLKVEENTDANVEDRISKEYDVLSWIPDMTITEDKVIETDKPIEGISSTNDRKHRTGVAPVTLEGYQDVLFKYESNNENVQDFEWSFAVYLNGKRLTPGTDYTEEEGSDAKNIKGQTIREAAQESKDGKITIDVVGSPSKDPSNTLKKNTSGNFNVNKPGS